MYPKYLHIFFGWRTKPPIEKRLRGGSKALCDLEK